MTRWLIKRGTALVPVPWRNGLGTTRDVVTVTGPDGALRWQVSIAELEQDAAFSDFPQCDRVFTPIAGSPPPELAFGDGPFEPCPLLVPRRFPGDIPTRCRIGAPGRAFNVIADRRHHAMAVEVVSLDAGIAVPGGPGIIYCHAGELTLGGPPVGPGDSLLSDAAGFPGAVSVRRPCVLILVTLRDA